MRGFKWLITAALPYANNLPHVGNIIGSHLPADIFSRQLRMFDEDVIFVGGTDEHGSPIEVAAFKAGKEPKELCDELHEIHKKIYDWLGISYDNFSRTSNPTNHQMTKYIFKKLLENGFIFKDKMIMPYCEKDKRFLPDRWVIGTCPYCNYESARGDQCEKCGKLLDPIDLINPKCVICGSKPIFKETEHLFLDLTKLENELKEWIEKNEHWKPHVKNLALGWIKEGLKPRSITRDLKWGIKVPLEGFENKVFYVWFDAPIGYISSTIEYFEKIGRKDEWKKIWMKGSNARIVHFLGKDNIPFHTIFWPAILLGTREFNLPYNVVGLQFLQFEGKKISKSKNWGVFIEIENDEIKIRIQDKKYKIEPDYLRFYLASIIPETKDSNFVLKDFKEKINNELIANFGNFAYRVLSFVKRMFNGKIKICFDDVKKELEEFVEKYKQAVFNVEIRKSLEIALEVSRFGNSYFQKNKPWEVCKENKEECEKIVCNATGILIVSSFLLYPFIPFSIKKLWEMIGIKEIKIKEIFDERSIEIKEIYPLFKPLKF